MKGIPKRKYNITTRIIASVTAFAFLFTTLPQDYLYAQSVNHLAIKPFNDLTNISIPQDLGNITQTFQGSSDKLVIHIQDLHTHYEAQDKEAKIIEYLMDKYGVNLVCVEGAEGDFEENLKFFRSYPEDDHLREKVARFFMKKGYLTGADYLGITKKNPPQIFGIENEKLYNKHLNIFNNCHVEKETLLKELKNIESILKRLQVKIYPHSLKKLNQTIEAYRQGKITYRQYIVYLIKLADKKNLSKDTYKNLELLSKATDLKYRIDFDAISREEEIDNSKVEDELYNLIDNLKLSLCKNELQKKLFKVSRAVNILIRLFNVQITNQDYQYYKFHQEDFNLPDIINFCLKYSKLYKIPSPNITYGQLYKLDKNFEESLDFYFVAFQRDNSFLDNTLNRMNQANQNKAVLISGGFHTRGLCEQLKEEDISYVVIAPVLTEAMDMQNYFEILKGKRLTADEILTADSNTLQNPNNIMSHEILPTFRTEWLGRMLIEAGNRIIIAEDEEDKRLLQANNASALLVSSGKYLISKEVAKDKLKLLRAITHEDIEALMQIIAKEDRNKYQGIKELILPQNEILEAYYSLFPQDKGPDLPSDLLLNDLLAKAFELIFIVDKKLLFQNEITPQESAFIQAIRPIIMANKHNYFTEEFWDSGRREKKVRDALNSGMGFYQVASVDARNAPTSPKQLIEYTIRILDSVPYENYSHGRTGSYPEYIAGSYADEKILIQPILFPRFLKEVLGFSMGESIWAEKAEKETGKIPDFIPIDQVIHPFVFDTKGSDTQRLSVHYEQISNYMAPQQLEFGILTNMRDLAVFTVDSPKAVKQYSFSFAQLYDDYKSDPKTAFSAPNTKIFLRFVEKFHYQSLSREEKIARIAESKPWTGLEELNIDALTASLHRIVDALYQDVSSSRDKLSSELLAYKPETQINIAREIDSIARSLDPATPKIEIGESTLSMMMKDGSDFVRARDVYFHRAAYFAMTRILLVKIWEDIGFIDQSLYDGGFKMWYGNFNKEIQRVLTNAFNLAAERYSWLYRTPNNYTWYTPSDGILIDVLYEFANFPLRKLNVDVLGTIYEDHLERADKKNIGQYYTPREIVSFIWDRVGFDNDAAFFKMEADRRSPRLIFDPATGSGGFLVEAARRMREEAAYDRDSFKDLLEVREAVIRGLCGSEISPFAHYITEVNLLIQLTSLTQRMLELRSRFVESPYSLSAVPADSLQLYNAAEFLFPMLDADMDDERREEEGISEILPLDEAKRAVFRRIKTTNEFDYAVANPPYIGEKGRKESFRSTLARFPYWKQFYQGKMDYLYWFVILGLSKLRNGGKLGYITTAYWPTANGASKLRQYILDNARICEIIDFGETQIFEHAPGQHNMVFVLERCKDSVQRRENRIRMVRVKRQFEGETARARLQRLIGHIEAHIDAVNNPKDEYSDGYIDIFISPVKQGKLTKDAWNLMHKKAADEVLNKIKERGQPLENVCEINHGVQSGCDKVSRENIKLLPASLIERHNIEAGDGIFILTDEELEALALPPDEQGIIRPFFKNSDIDPYYVYTEEDEHLIYADADTDIEKHPNIKAHLRKFKSILVKGGNVEGLPRDWFRLHRPRKSHIFEGPKIMVPYRARHNRFGYDTGSAYGSIDICYINAKKKSRESLKYVLALLNSKVLDFWCRYKTKPKGKMREYYASPLKAISIRRINFDDSDEVGIHDEMVRAVDDIIAAKEELAGYGRFFEGPRLTGLMEGESVPELNRPEVLKSLPADSLLSMRLYPQVTIEKAGDADMDKFYLRKVSDIERTLFDKDPGLKLTAKNRATVTIRGPPAILEFIAENLPSYRGKSWREINTDLLIPKRIGDFEDKKAQITKASAGLLARIASLQGRIDKIVCDLYGLNAEDIAVIKSGETSHDTNLSRGKVDEINETHPALDKAANEGRMFAVTLDEVEKLSELDEEAMVEVLMKNLVNLRAPPETRTKLLEKLRNSIFRDNLIKGFQLMKEATIRQYQESNEPTPKNLRLCIVEEESNQPTIVFKNIHNNLLSHSGKGVKTNTPYTSIYAGYNAVQYALDANKQEAFKKAKAHEARDIIRGHHVDDAESEVDEFYDEVIRNTSLAGEHLSQNIHTPKSSSTSNNQSQVIIKELNKGEDTEGIKQSLLEVFKMLGGAESIFRGKDTVLIKPSLATEKNAKDETTVNPSLIEAVVLILKELGVRRIIIGEGCVSEYNMEEIFKITGVCEIAKRHNVELINLNKAETIYIKVPHWKVWPNVKVSRIAAEADLIINIPRLTTHNQTVMSVATKNMKGVLPPVTKTFFHRGIDSEEKGIPHLAKAIVELNKALSRQIVIVDTTRSMEGDGPTRGEILNLHRIIVGWNPITVDRVCARIIGQLEKNIDFLRFAQEQDFGPDPVILGDKVEDVVSEIGRPFKEPSVTQVANPRINVYGGDTTVVCSKCYGSLGSAAEILGNKKWKNMLETNDIYLDIYMGSELPKEIEGKHYAVLMGRCPILEAKKAGISDPNIIRVIGCAPRTADVLNPIEAKVKFKEFNDEIQRLVEDLSAKEYAVPKLVIVERKLPGNEISQVIKKESEIVVIFDIEKLVYRKDFVFENFITIYWDVVGDIYSEIIRDVYGEIAKESGFDRDYIETFWSCFISQCDIRKTDTILDMGTGKGWMALLAAGKAEKAVGVDICPSLIDIARKNASLRDINNVKFSVGDATRCQFKDESFNVVISQYMFARLPKELRRRVLREAYRILTKKGLLRLWVYHPYVVPFAWDEDEWEKEIKAAGFEVESIKVKATTEYDTVEPKAIFIKAKKADLTETPNLAGTDRKDSELVTGCSPIILLADTSQEIIGLQEAMNENDTKKAATILEQIIILVRDGHLDITGYRDTILQIANQLTIDSQVNLGIFQLVKSLQNNDSNEEIALALSRIPSTAILTNIPPPNLSQRPKDDKKIGEYARDSYIVNHMP